MQQDQQLEQQQPQGDEHQQNQQQQQQQLQLQLQQKPVVQQRQQSESVQSHLQQQQAKDQQLEEQPAAKHQAQLSSDSWEQLMDQQTAALSASSPEPHWAGVEASGGQAEDSAPSPSTGEQEEEQLEDLEQAANEEEEEDNCAAAKRCAPLFSRTTLLPGMIPLSGLMNLGNAAQIAKSIPAELAGGSAAFPPLPLSRNSSRYL